jgi:hypothetical protein
VADGRLSEQIAHDIGIATVKVYRRRAMKKTNARFASVVRRNGRPAQASDRRAAIPELYASGDSVSQADQRRDAPVVVPAIHGLIRAVTRRPINYGLVSATKSALRPTRVQ